MRATNTTMAVAAGPVPPPEWYLARDGEQFGPLSDAELRKLVEFGHLKPTDLLWREGFPEWRSARILLSESAPTTVASALGTSTGPNAPTAQPQAGPTPGPDHGPAPASAAAGAVQTRTPHAHAAQPHAPTQRITAHGPLNPQAPNQQSIAPNVHAAHGAVAQMAGNQPVAATVAPPSHSGSVSAAYYPQPPQGYVAPVPHQSPRPGQHPAQQAHYAPPQPGGHASAMGAGPAARPMDIQRPAPAAPIATATRRTSAAPVHRADQEDDVEDDVQEGSRAVLWLKRVAVLLFFTLTLAAAAWYAYPHRQRLLSLLNLSSINLPSIPGLTGASPIVGFRPTVEATDAVLQKTALWKVLKREFPEWYDLRTKDAATLAAAQKGDAEIGRQMMQHIVALRRKHAGDALSATTPKLSAVASAFADNLERLRQVSIEACHTFVANGEVSAEYLRLLADASHASVLQAQLVAVFEAIADGRKIARVYPQPRQADYNLLVSALEARGWTDADMQLFSDSRRFGQAPPEKVCKMVTDWFRAQGDVKEPDALLRLLADALKPVVAG